MSYQKTSTPPSPPWRANGPFNSSIGVPPVSKYFLLSSLLFLLFWFIKISVDRRIGGYQLSSADYRSGRRFGRHATVRLHDIQHHCHCRGLGPSQSQIRFALHKKSLRSLVSYYYQRNARGFTRVEGGFFLFFRFQNGRIKIRPTSLTAENSHVSRADFCMRIMWWRITVTTTIPPRSDGNRLKTTAVFCLFTRKIHSKRVDWTWPSVRFWRHSVYFSSFFVL